MTDTPKNQTLITGQLLQIRDKLMAKRHLIPASFQAEWDSLAEKTEMFDPANQGQLSHAGNQMVTKHSAFKGTVNDLLQLVEAMRNLNRQIKITAH
ncbi:MAG: hypothetical protein SWN10_12800 [Pseudomonadota bacterium]|jgi:hypothetical protein|nr:hypothetical protein [Alteromonadaceae bacterium]MCP4862532.1 hypothetical protein [Alteromonas sp.]MDY6927964.1 hypothetical protein [Pseudomonadota bacterium]RPH16682.1 MAG: hypothetical protein CBB67_014720 [Alteromonadaceae bacterium TMED7]|tara:strand:+ start:5185 stop:5472 length:288 start_codon:yes stop_codon:yes gene_type:complete